MVTRSTTDSASRTADAAAPRAAVVTAVTAEASPLRRRALVALALALLATVVSRVVAAVALSPAAAAFDPLGIAPLAVAATVATLGAAAVYAVLPRVTDAPDRAFLAVSAVVLVASFVPVVGVAPSLPGATTGGLVVLGVAHVLVAAGIVGGLTGRVLG
ncbi:DUF6069 family protein [Halobaculum lipolyticum]|uniref:DUF6069 family protein n=1 Tax=Halobaculum lipolyticum TaxID=3032001 RepID=A0ABD5W9J4_9EURY|nr:DUF6069 family protein [Halobaculum sp. DT31]